MKPEFTIEEVRAFVIKGYTSVAARYAKAALQHFDKSSIDPVEEIYHWLMDENREPAQTRFTAGWQRNLAKEIEFRIKSSQQN